MSGTGARLRELLDNATSQVRLLARRRRGRHGIAAASSAAAACAAVSVLALGLAGPLSGHSTSPRPRSSAQAAGVPHYYIQDDDYDQAYNLPGGFRRALVRDTASGKVTATVRCPWTGAVIMEVAATSDEAFFIACQRDSGSKVIGSRLYRFELTSAGRVRGYTSVPGGVLPGTATSDLTAAAGGSEIAMVTSARAGYSVLVINTTTGAHSAWRGTIAETIIPEALTLSPNGRDLRFFTDGSEFQVSPASRGGLLSSARVLVRLAVADSAGVGYAQVSPSGSVLTVAALQPQIAKPPARVKATWIVRQISIPSGRVIRVLFRATLAINEVLFLNASSDPTGQYIILVYGTGTTKAGYRNGWLDHGRLVLLTPAHAVPTATKPASRSSIGPETW